MRLHRRLAALTFAVVTLAAAATAPCVLACYCQMPESIAADMAEDSAVVVGRVGPDVGGRQVLTVERWFRGREPRREIVLREPGDEMTSCDRFLVAGERVIVASTQDGDRMRPGLCTPWATVDSPLGRQWITEAERRFGAGVGVDEAAPEAPTTAAAVDFVPVIAGVGGAGLILGLGAAAVALRRRPEEP